MSAEKQLVVTKTGEPYQPLRIYYQVFKQKTVLSALKKLRCMEHDTQQQRWNWLYEEEAKKLRFERSRSTFTSDEYGIILGYFTFRGDQMLLDVRSGDRAIAALDFFGKRINRYAAQPTHLRVVNRYFGADEMPDRSVHPTLDQFFDRADIPCTAKEMEAELDRLIEVYPDDLDARVAAWSEVHKQSMDQPFPEVEELLFDQDDLGSAGLSMTLKMRQKQAFEYWQGNFTYRPSDMMRELTDAMMEVLGEEEFDADEAEVEEDEE